MIDYEDYIKLSPKQQIEYNWRFKSKYSNYNTTIITLLALSISLFTLILSMYILFIMKQKEAIQTSTTNAITYMQIVSIASLFIIIIHKLINILYNFKLGIDEGKWIKKVTLENENTEEQFIWKRDNIGATYESKD